MWTKRHLVLSIIILSLNICKLYKYYSSQILLSSFVPYNKSIEIKLNMMGLSYVNQYTIIERVCETFDLKFTVFWREFWKIFIHHIHLIWILMQTIALSLVAFQCFKSFKHLCQPFRVSILNIICYINYILSAKHQKFQNRQFRFCCVCKIVFCKYPIFISISFQWPILYCRALLPLNW